MSSKNSDTRTRILIAASDLLLANQGKGVRMSDIAKKTNLSRQALYLHFATRTELLIATTHYWDDLKGSDERLLASRTAKSGEERLTAFIAAWTAYIPEIYGIAKALMALGESDDAAREAWDKRMQDLREGCQAAIEALDRDGQLTPHYPVEQATDLLWTLLSVRNWEQLIQSADWSQQAYARNLQTTARKLFIKQPET
ncbi:TetR/AcrR family transcriptional regulator [Rhodovibrionaceae bacterium A322]